MGEGADELNEAPARRRRFASWSRRRRIALGIALVVLAALIGLWVERKPIASRVISGELTKRGVVARYDVRDLGFGRQRLTNVVIGDPADPDLVADWLETRTRIGLDGASLVGVRAGRVRLRGRMIDGRLSLGETVGLFWHCLHGAPEGVTRDALGEAVAETGLAEVTPVLGMLLRQILVGR